MYFAILCQDKPNNSELRLETRPRHLAYLKSLGSRLKFAGPFVDEDGQANGSLIVIEVENQSEAELVAAHDPYAQVGLFASYEVRRWNWTVHNPKDS